MSTDRVATIDDFRDFGKRYGIVCAKHVVKDLGSKKTVAETFDHMANSMAQAKTQQLLDIGCTPEEITVFLNAAGAATREALEVLGTVRANRRQRMVRRR